MDIAKIMGSLFGGVAGGMASPAETVVAGVKGILGMVKLSPELKAQLDAQLTAENVDLEKAQLAASLAVAQGQLEINKQEAASTSLFIAGWRPAVGWVCVTALAYAYVLEPFLKFVVAIHHPDLVAHLPVLDTGNLLSTLLIPLLGLGALRTFEKVKGADANRGGGTGAG